MRWLVPLAEPIDLGKLPNLAVRYRATGKIKAGSYGVWLGTNSALPGKKAVIPLSAGDLRAEGAWHRFEWKAPQAFVATHLAIGLDSAGPEVELELGPIHFSSLAMRWPIAEALPHRPRSSDLHDSSEWIAQPVQTQGGRRAAFFAQRLGLSDWFSQPRIECQGVPFVVENRIDQLLATPTGQFGTLSIDLPPDVREVYLLTATTAPPTEPWGIDWNRPKPQEVLDVPEKVFYEIRYREGPPDQVLPLDVATGQWGMKRGVSVNVVQPDPKRQATQLVLHDRMQTAAFAIVGATMRTAVPRIAAPTWDLLARGLSGGTATEPAPNRLPLEAEFKAERGLRWSRLGIPGRLQELSCWSEPLFRVTQAGRQLPDEDWRLERTERLAAGSRFVLINRAAELEAMIDSHPADDQLRLRMSLKNLGKQTTTATLHFPILSGVQIGSAADTWYLCGKRGGIIHHAPISIREPLGEPHPLQMDGFFNPSTGLALACLTHDIQGQHHWINLAKNDRGGDWSIEYVGQDLPPGSSLATSEAALIAAQGGWRAIFAQYQARLASWFRPAAPRKPWFERAFAIASANVHYDAFPNPQDRSDIQRHVDTMRKYLGACDYVHLYGWGASKTYGDWGDYDHYDEVGGLNRFRQNIAATQAQGILVSLYLDAYLNSEKGQFAGDHARQWAMKRADGSPQFVPVYSAYNQCPYLAGWREYLARTYKRVQQDLGPKILYIDEAGATDGRWACHAPDHGHNRYEIPYRGEVELLHEIRKAVGPEAALYTEYSPAEASRRYLDGSISYQALWSADQEGLSPHFIDLPRFAFPDFKQFHIIYYVGNRAGNWWLLKFPFFNGEVYRVGTPNLPGMDEPSLAFLKRAVSIQCGHREAFASHDVTPLVSTLASGVFANRFGTAGEIVWTLYNAGGRCVRGPVLRVPHLPGATYRDLWNESSLAPELKDSQATLTLELMPKGVGCVVQARSDARGARRSDR